jgi:hypothetical protein
MKRAFSLLALAGLPLVSYAQSLNLSPVQKIISAIATLVGTLVPVLVTLGLVVFLWGLVRYLWGGGSKPDIANAKKLMMWGLVTLFVMISVWGIIDLMQRSLDIDKNATGRAPQIQYTGSSNASASGANVPCTGGYLDCK